MRKVTLAPTLTLTPTPTLTLTLTRHAFGGDGGPLFFAALGGLLGGLYQQSGGKLWLALPPTPTPTPTLILTITLALTLTLTPNP